MLQTAITRSLKPADLPAISALHAEVFGPGRFTRSAYRVREGKGQFSRYCRVADLGGRIIAALRLTEVTIGGTGGAALLGPLAVAPDFAGQGFGRKLVGEALTAMKSDGVKLVVLVGDVPYYGRFGFKPVTPGQITFPGPVNPARILAVELVEDAIANYSGRVSARSGQALSW